MPLYWSVAIDAPLDQVLTYLAPDSLGPLQRGQSVIVPLGKKRNVHGVLISSQEDAPETKFAIKEIISVHPERPIIPEPTLKWLEWLSNYYIFPLGLVIELTFPPLDKATSKNKTRKSSVTPLVERTGALNLTEEQEETFNNISRFTDFSAHLIFGVTGSGKTEVYLRLLQNCLESGKSGIVLVPEISLTPQLINRFMARFGDQVAVIHSQLTERERTNNWWDFVEKKKNILIGARSAIFCPRDDIGMIIVDEEHEASYKQDEKLKYHGRDSAVMLAKFLNCPIILGSATPSLETWKNILDKKYHLHQMTRRVSNRPMPTVVVVDLKEAKEKRTLTDLPFWMTEELFKKITFSLENKEQVALFLNRRGMAQMVLCPACGHTRECPNCDINLTLHAGSHMICHYCDYHENFKPKCPDCLEGELQSVGLGTELVEQDLQKLFPEARLARADRDEITNRLDLEDLISRMEKHEIDILVGTQMIAKGLDFPKLKLVGLLLADVGFNFPDFRSTERSYQLMTQMSGRAGRHVAENEAPGEVVIQTFNPAHPAIVYSQNETFENFALAELEARKSLNYPPEGKLIAFKILGETLDSAQRTAEILARRGQMLKEKFAQYADVEILGPAQAPLAKLRGKFRHQLLLKGSQHQVLNSLARQMVGTEDWIPAKVKVAIDVDPLNLL